jgi:hypothetical protein
MKLPQIDGITVHCAHTKIVPVDDLKPYPRNNKTHPEAQIALMCKAIKAQGWRAPITVSNQSGYIVRGHGRLEAAKRLGLKSVPVDYQNYASTAAEQADRIADNKLAELAEWDLPALKEELLELDTGDLDMDITGFDAGALEELMTQFHISGDADAEPQIDKAEELNKKWKVKTGDLFTIGEHRLVCGDSTKAEDVGRATGGEMADAVVTDSPYGINRDGIKNDDPEGLRTLFDGLLSVFPSDNAVVINFQSPRLFPVWIDAIRQAGHKFERALWFYDSTDQTFPWRGWIMTSQIAIVSTVGDGVFADGHYHHDCYLVTTAGKAGFKRGGYEGNGVAIGGHTTMKPLDIIQELLSHTVGLVYDPFLGSGTTMVAAQNLSRKCYGLEISPAYCAVILQRMTEAFPGIKIKRAP